MAVSVVMPQLGESVVEGTITKWLVKVGDAVQKDQSIVTVATDKADNEIPAPASGVVTAASSSSISSRSTSSSGRAANRRAEARRAAIAIAGMEA